VKIVLATCRKYPELQPSDRLLAHALERGGAHVAAAPWNGPFEPFAAADLVVIRSTWDYPEAADAFRSWLRRFGAAPRVANPPGLMLWNLDKSYLLSLAASGAPMPATAQSDGDAAAILATMGALGLAEAVVKPVIGASARGVSIVRRDDPATIDSAAAKLKGGALVQALIPEIRTAGETSLIYFGGDYSHAVVKRPFPGSILVQEEHGGRTEIVWPPEWAVEDGLRLLAMLPERPVYARIDVVLRAEELDARLALMEVELIEPELFLTHDAAAAERFAAALMRELDFLI